jgi:hypothetical protein
MYTVYTPTVLFEQQCSVLQMRCTVHIVAIAHVEVVLLETQQCTDFVRLHTACDSMV